MDEKHKSIRGFTIVELLIVIVVIGILAAITIVAYNGIQARANMATLQADTRNSAQQIESFKIQNTAYPVANDCSTTPAVNTICLKNSPGTVFSYNPASGSSSFCLESDSTLNSSISSYYYSSKSGSVQTGVCPGGWSAIWAGYNNTCGTANGQLYCWGYNAYGQLGTGDTTNYSTPQLINTGAFPASSITKMTMGSVHNCTVAGGKAYCWGTNNDGELGDIEGLSYSPYPVKTGAGQQLNGKTVTDINAGIQNTCAVANGQFYCWGSGGNGQDGNGANSNQYWPVAVSTGGVLSGKTAQVLASGSGYYSTCGVATGASYCWGANFYANFGDGTNGTQSNIPIATATSGVLSGKTVTAISVGAQQVCAIASGAAYCWGTGGGLGNGTSNASTTPVAVDTSGGDLKSSQTITAIATTVGSSCLLADSQLYCWGSGMPWNKANGSSYSTDPHYPYSPIKAIGPLANVKFVSLSGTYSHMCAMSDSGYGYCWGPSSYGEAGNAFGTLVSNAYKFSAP